MTGALTVVDTVLVGIILISAIISLVRGFLKEALSLITWIAAFFIAKTFSTPFSQILEPVFEAEKVRYGFSFGILFALTLLVGGVINFLISKIVSVTGLGVADRILGTVFGFARGVILITVAVFILRGTPVANQDGWQQSQLLPHIELLADWSEEHLPELSDSLDIQQSLDKLSELESMRSAGGSMSEVDSDQIRELKASKDSLSPEQLEQLKKLRQQYLDEQTPHEE